MTEFLQHLDYYLVASFKVGKRRLKYYAQGAFDAACSLYLSPVLARPPSETV
jgi:hypothetical protein